MVEPQNTEGMGSNLKPYPWGTWTKHEGVSELARIEHNACGVTDTNVIALIRRMFMVCGEYEHKVWSILNIVYLALGLSVLANE